MSQNKHEKINDTNKRRFSDGRIASTAATYHFCIFMTSHVDMRILLESCFDTYVKLFNLFRTLQPLVLTPDPNPKPTLFFYVIR